MSLTDLLTQDVELTARVDGPVDEFGDPTMVDGPGTWVKGLLQIRSTSEDPETNAERRRTAVLYLPVGTVVAFWDHATVNGERWEVDGDTEQQYNPRARVTHHVKAEVSQAYG